MDKRLSGNTGASETLLLWALSLLTGSVAGLCWGALFALAGVPTYLTIGAGIAAATTVALRLFLEAVGV